MAKAFYIPGEIMSFQCFKTYLLNPGHSQQGYHPETAWKKVGPDYKKGNKMCDIDVDIPMGSLHVF